MIYFSDWMSLFRIIIISVAGYIALITILRISGNRTLSKMNSFDFIITIALGSTFASSILQKNVALLDGILAMAMLVGLQFMTTWLSVRSRRVSRIVKSNPVMLYENGKFMEENMRRAHVTKDEILAGVRQHGLDSPASVKYIILETNGKISACR